MQIILQLHRFLALEDSKILDVCELRIQFWGWKWKFGTVYEILVQ